jgi:hypothetical protein
MPSLAECARQPYAEHVIALSAHLKSHGDGSIPILSMWNIKLFAGIAAVVVLAATAAAYLAPSAKPTRSVAVPSANALDDPDTQALRQVIETADRLSGFPPSAFTLAVVDRKGRSGNFGVYLGSTGERLAEERFVQFSSPENLATPNENAEVDPATHRVVALHRNQQFSSTTKIEAELDRIVQDFVRAVEPDFAALTREIPRYTVDTKSGPRGEVYFFRWRDAAYRSHFKPGVEIDNEPVMQVGINDSGYIFSYDNTLALYRNALNQDSVKPYLNQP